MNGVKSPKPTFVFINDTPNPNEHISLSKRKAVRAHAARCQKPQNGVPQPPKGRSAARWNKYQARKRNRDMASTNTFPLSINGLGTLTPPDKSEAEDEKSPREDEKSSRDDETGETELQTGWSTSEESETVLTNGQASWVLPRMPGAGWVTPFVSLEKLGKTYFPLLVNHYLANLATDIPELDAGVPFILRVRWFPMVITSSATLHVVLLTAASHYAAVFHLVGHEHIQQVLLHLKYKTLSSINYLIQTSDSTLYSDAVIGAVAKLASYEAMFGSSELYHTHMRGLRNMIQIRGGLESLGLDGLLTRMVLWIDINSAFLLGSAPYFLPIKPLAGHISFQPNPVKFLAAK